MVAIICSKMQILMQNFAVIMLKKLVLQLQDSFSWEILEFELSLSTGMETYLVDQEPVFLRKEIKKYGVSSSIYWTTILVTSRWNRNCFFLIFLKIFYIHSSHLCSHSNVPLSFPNVEPRIFWSTEMTVIPKSTLGKEKHTQVFQNFWRVL